MHVEGAPRVPAGFFEYCNSKQIPVLGICYGMQLMVQQLGGIVHETENGGEYGRMVIRASGGSQLYAYDSSEHGVHKESVWMSHGDSIDKLPEGFQPVATSEQVLTFSSHALLHLQALLWADAVQYAVQIQKVVQQKHMLLQHLHTASAQY